MSGGDRDADVIIIGAGIAGAMVAHKLAAAGVKVLVLEGGPDITRAELHARLLKTKVYSPVDLDPQVSYAPTTNPREPDSYLLNVGKASYNVHMTKAVGGSTWHWGGAARRFLDHEFKLKSTYGVGADWPISYGDLEPYYVEAEHAIGVSAPSRGQEAQRRSKPTPMSDFVWPHFYKRLREILAPAGYDVETGAFARNSREYQGRPACRGNNTCWPLCPIGAQYNAIVHVDKARALGVEVRPQALAVQLEVDRTRRIRAVVFRRPDGSHERASANVFVVAANGLETPKLLLASRSEMTPAGVANSSDMVGRNLMDHSIVWSGLLASQALFPGRGPIEFGEIRGFEDGVFRKQRAATSMVIENRMSVDEITRAVLLAGFKGDECDREIRFRVARSFALLSEVEILPRAESRMTLDWQNLDSAGQPRMRINLDIDEYTARSIELMADAHAEIAKIIGVLERKTLKRVYFGNHPSGAARMGSSPRSSVVDRHCRSHDHHNLYIAGSAVFPTLGGARGPTLTIAALALKTANSILVETRK